MSRKEVGRGHANIKDSTDASVLGFEDYIKKSKERQTAVTSNSNGNMRTNRRTKKKKKKKRKKERKKNNCIETLSKKTGKVAPEMTRRWLRNENLNR